MTQRLLKNGADVDAQATIMSTPLSLASANLNYTEIVQLLLDYGAVVNGAAYKKTNMTPSYQAEDEGILEKVKLLVEHRANANVKCDCCDETPLHYAAELINNNKILKFLLVHGADINHIAFKREDTPLHCAVKPKYNMKKNKY